jgi:hypothetical protein
MPEVRLLEPRGGVELRFAAVGDIGAIGRIRARGRSEGYDAVFAPMAGALARADLAFANLEMPVGAPEWVRSGCSPEFWHERAVVEALGRAGVRLVSLGNNHAMDCGPRGLERSLESCREAGIQTIGAGRNLEEARKAARFAIGSTRVVAVAYSASTSTQAAAGRPGTAPLDAGLIRGDLRALRGEADLLVVSVHWGSMYVDHPPGRVFELAQLLAEEADVVLGHHPHVTQGYRRGPRKMTLFSLGDACFDAKAGDVEARVAAQVRRETGVFTVLWADEPGLEYLSLTLDNDGVPSVSGPDQARSQAARLQRLSAEIAEGGDRFMSESAPTLLRYELDTLVTHLRRGRLDRAFRLLGSLRLRHLPVLWNALRRRGKKR